MLTLKQLLSLALCSSLAVSATTFAYDSMDDSPDDANDARNKPQIFRVSSDMDIVTKIKFQYAKPRIAVKSVYPELQSDTSTYYNRDGDSVADHDSRHFASTNPNADSGDQSNNDEPYDGVDGFDDAVINLVKEKIADFQSLVKSKIPDPDALNKFDTNRLYIDYSTSTIKSGDDYVMSILFNSQGLIVGEGRPYHRHFVLNYDISNNRPIELADLFDPTSNYLDVISQYCYQSLSRHLADKQMVQEGTAPKEENFANWNIKPTGILFTFDESQVAPYASGTQKVLVPFSELKSILLPDSIISSCIKHKGRCLANNVLTGGFLDEAKNKNNEMTPSPLPADDNHMLQTFASN